MPLPEAVARTRRWLRGLVAPSEGPRGTGAPGAGAPGQPPPGQPPAGQPPAWQPSGFPDAETLAVIERFARWLRQGHGLSIRGRPSGRSAAAGLDFLGYVDYAPGMDLRHLDWNLWARSRGRYVRRYADEAAGRLVVLLDASGSMGIAGTDGVSKLDLGRKLAAALSYSALAELHAVYLGVVQHGQVQGPGFGEGLPFAATLFGALGAARAEGPSDLGGALAGLALGAGHGDALLIGDHLDPGGAARGLDALVRLGLRPDLVRICAPEEFTLPPAGTPLADPEGGEHRPAPAGAARDRLAARIEAHRGALAAAASARGATLIEVSTDQPFAGALSAVLAALSAAHGPGAQR